MISSLAKIVDNSEHPMTEFKKWFTEVDPYEPLKTICVASLNKEYGVLNRTVMYRGYDQNGVIFATEKCSRKYADMKENPQVAATILWKYKKGDQYFVRQVRLTGLVEELSEADSINLYNEEPTFGKIRCKICKCGEPVDWDVLKKRHDQTVADVTAGTEKLEWNGDYTALRIVPKLVDFYVSGKMEIGDRIIYKLGTDGQWINEHVCC